MISNARFQIWLTLYTEVLHGGFFFLFLLPVFPSECKPRNRLPSSSNCFSRVRNEEMRKYACLLCLSVYQTRETVNGFSSNLMFETDLKIRRKSSLFVITAPITPLSASRSYFSECFKRVYIV